MSAARHPWGHGPKCSCGLNVCKSCTSHINDKVLDSGSVPVSKIKESDEITIEGLLATAGREQRPMQEAWLEEDV